MKDLNNYYHFIKFSVSRKLQELFVTISVPITTFREIFYLYSVHSFPKQVDLKNEHATSVIKLPKFLAVTTSTELHAVFDDKPVLHPGDQYDIVFASDIQLKTSNSDHCIMSIYRNDPVLVHEYCEIMFNLKKPKVALQMTENEIVIEGKQNYTVRCDEQTENYECSSCLVILKPGCSLETDDTVFPAKKVQKLTNIRNTTTRFLVNLAVIQNFFQTGH